MGCFMDRINLQHLFFREINNLRNKLSNKFISNMLIQKRIDNLEESLCLLDNQICMGKKPLDKTKILFLIHDKGLKRYMKLFIDEYEKGNHNYSSILCDRIRNDYGKYCNILHNYNIYNANVNESFIFNYSTSDLKIFLRDLIFKYGVSKHKAYSILCHSNPYRICNVFSLIDKYDFSFDREFDVDKFFYKMCDLEDDTYEVFSNNVLFLLLCGFSFKINSYSNVKLMSDDKFKFKDNISLIESYGLMGELYNLECDYYLFNILFSDNLGKKIDDIIEMGCYDFLKNNLASLTSDYTKRLQVLKCIDTPVFDQETYDITMKSSIFVLDDDEIDNEMYSAVDSHESINLNLSIADLEQFRCSDNCYLYNIGGVLVSRPKVKRLLEEGKDIYTSIFTGLVISDDEYNRMMDVLQPLQYIKK